VVVGMDGFGSTSIVDVLPEFNIIDLQLFALLPRMNQFELEILIFELDAFVRILVLLGKAVIFRFLPLKVDFQIADVVTHIVQFGCRLGKGRLGGSLGGILRVLHPGMKRLASNAVGWQRDEGTLSRKREMEWGSGGLRRDGKTVSGGLVLGSRIRGSEPFRGHIPHRFLCGGKTVGDWMEREGQTNARESFL
jgi:hypothetical protein